MPCGSIAAIETVCDLSGRDCFHVGNVFCARGCLREHLAKVMVGSRNQTSLRSKVCGQVEWSDGESSQETGTHGFDETLHAGLAKEIDGLFGIADEKDRLALVSPAVSEAFDELVLLRARVLHFVNE